MTEDQTEKQRETSVIKAERVAARLGLQSFERFDKILAAVIAVAMLVTAWLGMTVR